MNCAISGCANRKRKNTDKYFFNSTRKGLTRELWVKATGKPYTPNSQFLICEDHFDLREDIDFYRINGTPLLKKSAFPHRNLTLSDMALQAKLDKVNWSCFVPSCENKRLMSDKKVVFFAVPEGLKGQQWTSVVMEDASYSNASLLDGLQFFCEDHFDITMDFDKNFHFNSSVEYTTKAGTVPSLNLSESKLNIRNKRRLCDEYAHPRLLLNNEITYLCGSKFPILMEKLQMADDIAFVNMKDIKTEPVELEELTDIKTEPMDTGYELSCEFVIKEEELYVGNNPLHSEPECQSESESESESSVTNKQSNNDPDITTDDFSTSDDDDGITSDDSFDPESSETETDEDSDCNTAERFECCHCKLFVRHLESHVERVHLNFSKNVNRTICGLCLETFPRKVNLGNHQITVHNGNAYACNLCDCMTRTFGAIQRHIVRTHSNERTFLCQHCAQSYKFIWELRRHVRNVHMGVKRERSHACHMCDKKFFTSQTLKKHINSVHLNLRPFSCNFDGCGKTFNKKINLKYHRQVHTKENLFACIICDKKFTFKGNLKAHLKNIHKT